MTNIDEIIIIALSPGLTKFDEEVILVELVELLLFWQLVIVIKRKISE